MTQLDSGGAPERPGVISRRQAIKAGSLVAGVAWISPVITTVPLTSSAAAYASGMPRSKADGREDESYEGDWHDESYEGDWHQNGPVTSQQPADGTVRVLSQSQVRAAEPDGDAPVATATSASVQFVG